MDYKAIIKSRETRDKILKMLSWIPDKVMLQIQYRIKFNRKLNLKEPRRFTEKIQWYKLYYKNPELIRCVDKAEVRNYLKERGFEKYLLTCYGVYSSVDSIDFEKLPNSFVMKDTLGGGGNSVLIVKDKKSANIDELKIEAQKWCNKRVRRGGGREWPYYCGKNHRIIIEEYLQSESPHGLIDYKFYCFNGCCEYLKVILEHNIGEPIKRFYLTRDYIDTGAHNPDEIKVSADELPSKPQNFDELLSVAEQLSQGFPCVRVDLYSCKIGVRFGELTFYDASGYFAFEPDSFDYELGSEFILPEKLGGLL